MKKRISFYSSVEEQSKAQMEEVMKLSPQERIAKAVQLIKTIYPKVENPFPKRITFYT